MALLTVLVPATARSGPDEGGVLPVGEIAAASAPAVVVLRSRGEANSEPRYGSGFLVDPGGTLVTALHLIDGADKVLVRTADGERYRRVGVRAFDAASDLVVLQIDGANLPVVEVGDSSGLKSGDPIMVIGNPRALARTVTEGIVSAWRDPLPDQVAPDELEEDEEFGQRRRIRAVPDARILQISAPISPGSSGSPVFGRSGEVVGMAVAGVSYGELGLNFAIPARLITPLLDVDQGLTLSSFQRRVDRTHEELAEPHVDQARLALELERYDEAGREIDAALQLHPGSLEALLLESELLRRLGDPEGAERVLLQVTGRHPESADAWYRLGTLYLESGAGGGRSLPLARAALEKALELDDDLAAAARGLGVIAYREGLYLSATRHLERAWGSGTEDPETALWLGEVYLQADRESDARTAFESALELDSEDPRAHHGLARAYIALGQDATGRAHWRSFLELTEGVAEFKSLRERTILYLRRYPRLVPLEYSALLDPRVDHGEPE